MILSLTTDKISIITSETCDVDVVASFIDRNQSSGSIGSANRQITNIVTGTTTDIVASPGASTTRKIQQITIRNAHASTAVDVVVQLNANGTLYEFYGTRLYPTESCFYDLDRGFTKKVRPTGQLRTVRIGDNFILSESTTVPATAAAVLPLAITSVRFPSLLASSRFGVFGWLNYTSAISTTGMAITVSSNEDISLVCSTIGVSTNSVTGATLNTTTDNDGIPQAAGTSGGATPVDVFLAAGLIHQGQITAHEDLSYLGIVIGSEVAGSLVSTDTYWFDFFEATN